MFKLLLLLILCGPGSLIAQKRFIPDSLDPKFVLLAPGTYTPDSKFPFSAISVTDSRYDTSKVGFFYSGNKVGSKKIVIAGGLAGAASAFYNQLYKNSFSTSDSIQLVIVIKKFWADPKPNPRLQTPAPNARRNSLFDLHVQFELLFRKGDSYLPLKRIDTVFQWVAGTTNPDYNFYKARSYNEYEYALIKVMKSADFINYASSLHKAGRPRTIDEINSFNKGRFRIPILQDSVLKAGVYLSFSEFRNNNPSIEKYRLVANDQAGNMVYNDLPGDSARIFKFWGFCDGKKIYIGKIRHPLKRVGNTFDVFADDISESLMQISSPSLSAQSVAAALITSAIDSKYHYLEPFQLDMDTGKIY